MRSPPSLTGLSRTNGIHHTRGHSDAATSTIHDDVGTKPSTPGVTAGSGISAINHAIPAPLLL